MASSVVNGSALCASLQAAPQISYVGQISVGVNQDSFAESQQALPV